MSPLCQTHITQEQLGHMERYYPLHAYVCESCFLVQLGEFVAPGDIFSEYAYFSSYSDSWVEHARRYTDAVVARFGLGKHSRVIEIASNDGYLLQHFVARGVPVLGIEPAANVALAAEKRGVQSKVCFFGTQTALQIAHEFGQPDLLLGNNVLAHVPQLNDFVGGMKALLSPRGVITMEFPHLLELMLHNQFDTIYHEHFSYFSLTTVRRIFASHGLTLFDVERLPTHGGSLRIYARHSDDPSHSIEQSIGALIDAEHEFGLDGLARYAGFASQVQETKRALLAFLIEAKNSKKRILGYGAPGKGNTLLNYCGIGTDFLDFTVDRNPYKQGKFTPGMRIPILSPQRLIDAKPDYVLILPWNLKEEIISQVRPLVGPATRFIVPIPQVSVVD